MPLGTKPEPQELGKPPIDELMKHADSKYALAIFAAKRARQINSYFGQLNEGLLQNVGPLVEYDNSDKPLSIAFREINSSLLEETLGADEAENGDVAGKRVKFSSDEEISVNTPDTDANDSIEDEPDLDDMGDDSADSEGADDSEDADDEGNSDGAEDIAPDFGSLSDDDDE